MKRIFYYTASFHDEGLKIYEFLKKQGYSKAVLTHIRKTQDGILLNGHPAFSSVRLKKEDRLTISLVDEKPSETNCP